ncbi:nucleoside transporter C-terminal domain-containing protein [Lactobacillus sp. ESL0681]|uniref:NupC/NupG family nucleoside CNT transporter n=1 Tax=Lactobacillus sp. ESL0681 TaxID=2983211 RepID=UPI0023F8B671|nr:nucleoside transporter C-terminal domain-containing protein [Lactobacillus sp. ESL0681]WEV39657.1 NupC/NupG family nucleoside CNT transporter [Lactobacillus sp. ESL0681]
MQFLFLLTGMALVFIIGWLVSNDRKHIKFKKIGIMFALQLLISFLCLKTSGGVSAMGAISNFFGWLMTQAAAGVNFVFGGVVIKKGSSVFFLDVLMPIVFISALVGILNYLKILPFIIKWTGFLLNKLAGMGDLESYFAVSTAILGQPEVFLTVKEQIPKLDEKRLYTICASAMSAVSAAVLASYMQLVPGKFVVTAVFLNILSALIVTCIVNPYDVTADNELHVEAENTTEKEPFFQVVGNYIQDGFNMAITVAAMLIGFVALISFLNSAFTNIFHISFTSILGYIFSPIAFIMGVPVQDVTKVGSLMATKILTNEFVALGDLTKIAATLTPKANAIISSYLISFANFGVIGIITGSIRSISKKAGTIVSKFSMKLLLGATLASILTGTIVGIYF